MAVCCILPGCTVPYPVVIAAGPFEVPPSPQREPLSAAGARVQVVSAPPPGCMFIGLATGVGGTRRQKYVGYQYLAAYRAEAVVALRNAVGSVGGSHTIVDVEVEHSDRGLLEAIVLRGPALRCP